ncbi:MAG: DUF3825 domain-containing protein [Erysipelotrichaceae bacterium]|nr:DUF3825 domain-containing protein [Erysipelotrichaceae bacterium]
MKTVKEYIEDNKNEEVSKLKRFAMLGNKEFQAKKWKELSELAEPEIWTTPNSNMEYDILYNYITYTFERLVLENKVVISFTEQFAAFNTGLLTEHGEDIVCLFNSISNKKGTAWHLHGFYAETERIIGSNFKATPAVAEYFDNPEDMYFNPKYDILANFSHILEDNLDRFPQYLQEKGIKYLRNQLNANIPLTKKRIARNYRIAVPQYYMESITYLVPLYFDETIMALAIEKLPSDRYRANTIFNLNMAYKNARLLMKPEANWLEIKRDEI